MRISEALIWTTLLISLNAYFVVCEIVLISVRKTKISEWVKAGRRRARLVKFAIKHLKIFLPTIQVGVTVTSIALGLIGSPWLEKFLESLLPIFVRQAVWFPQLVGPLSLISFLILTYFQLVFGELLPKTLTLRKPEKYSLWVIPPLFVFVGLFWPLTWLVNMTTYKIISLLGIKNVFHDRPYSEEEIKMILSHSGKVGEISTTEMEMAYNVFKLKKIKVDTIMIPIDKLIAFENKSTLKQVKNKIAKLGMTYNRYPVYKKTLDNIVGFFHITDLFRSENNEISLAKGNFLRKVLYIHEDETAEKLMVRMKQKEVYLAVVHDDHKKTMGIVSLTDIVDKVLKSRK
ncbi:HlyC/CorC family transporter [Candidatus Roizmanbacteria bacterium]|nr:HlyC/CorC family transporter [Candidatus Roizmanbacteria bacterium]